MRNNKSNKSNPTTIKRKLFGKKIKKQDLAIPNSTVNFFEDLPLYRHKSSKTKPKHTHRTRRGKA